MAERHGMEPRRLGIDFIFPVRSLYLWLTESSTLWAEDQEHWRMCAPYGDLLAGSTREYRELKKNALPDHAVRDI